MFIERIRKEITNSIMHGAIVSWTVSYNSVGLGIHLNEGAVLFHLFVSMLNTSVKDKETLYFEVPSSEM